MENRELRTYYHTCGYTAREFFRDALADQVRRSLNEMEVRRARDDADTYEETWIPADYAVTYYDKLTHGQPRRWR